MLKDNSTLLLLMVILLVGCQPKAEKNMTMNDIAEAYVKLVLDIGQYDSDFVDAYYGPEDWKPNPGEKRDTIPSRRYIDECQQIQKAANDLEKHLLTDAEKRRLSMMQKQLLAVETKVRMLGGTTYSFDVEAEKIYDAIPPHYDSTHFNRLLADLESELPGEGSLSSRYRDFEKQFVIPKERLDTVFQTAIREARKRTLQHYDLPDDEHFEIEYVTDKAWSGYNYYKGNGFSLIQLNTDLPIYIDRAIDLACHEGYPGHHVFNALLEKHLVNELGWKEYSVYPLFSPQSLIAEGSANYGIDVAFPGEERWRFEKTHLYPLAGINPELAEKYHRIQALRGRLDYAGNEAARAYLNGSITREVAASWLEKYLLYEPERALQRTRFFDQYRSYVINYNLGRDLVASYVERRGGTVENPNQRWVVFQELLSTPYAASDLK